MQKTHILRFEYFCVLKPNRFHHEKNFLLGRNQELFFNPPSKGSCQNKIPTHGSVRTPQRGGRPVFTPGMKRPYVHVFMQLQQQTETKPSAHPTAEGAGGGASTSGNNMYISDMNAAQQNLQRKLGALKRCVYDPNDGQSQTGGACWAWGGGGGNDTSDLNQSRAGLGRASCGCATLRLSSRNLK